MNEITLQIIAVRNGRPVSIEVATQITEEQLQRILDILSEEKTQ